MKLKLSKKTIIICGSVLSLILGLGALFVFYIGPLYFEYYINDYMFYKIMDTNAYWKLKEERERNETGPSVSEYRRQEREKEERGKEIEYTKKSEEYLKNKKSPAEYFSLLEKGKIYFVSHIDYIESDYGNALIEAEIINNIPVLRQLEYIHGKKIKFTDIILDEQFDNPHLPEKYSGIYDCDFAFFDKYSDSKENLDNISSYIKFLEEDGEMKIWACYSNNAYGEYGPQSIENIL